MSKNEKALHKKLKEQFKKKSADAFEDSLPMSRAQLEDLFDYLDDQLQESECDDSVKITTSHLQNQNITNVTAVLSWLSDHGGHCDCEVLANVEEHFD